MSPAEVTAEVRRLWTLMLVDGRAREGWTILVAHNEEEVGAGEVHPIPPGAHVKIAEGIPYVVVIPGCSLSRWPIPIGL